MVPSRSGRECRSGDGVGGNLAGNGLGGYPDYRAAANATLSDPAIAQRQCPPHRIEPGKPMRHPRPNEPQGHATISSLRQIVV
jgi:hypothetical protein